MSKISLYDAIFPFSFETLINNIESKDNDSFNSLKVVKIRPDYYEFQFTNKSITTEEYLDIYNKKNCIEKLLIQEIFFRVYDRKENNFIIFNEPRSILKLKNYLSKSSNFEFSLNKKSLNLNFFLKKNLNHINYISRIDIGDIIHIDHVFEKKILFTQNSNANLIKLIEDQLKSSSFKIFKVEFFLKKIPESKVTLSHDLKMIHKTKDLDNLLINFLDFF